MKNEEKSKGELFEEALSYKSESAWLKVEENESRNAFDFCEQYKVFLNSAKTERESIIWAEDKAKENGFVNLNDFILENKKLKSGDKVYAINKGKNIILAIIGNLPLEKGINMVGSHVDAPRIDLKPNPLYEGSELSLFKTHYYGGIKKYQWTVIPLAIHGVVVKGNGERVTISIGEDDADPKFCITDLLPHLAQEQMKKPLSEGIIGEGLNLLVGHIPYNDKKVKEKIKTNILLILNEKYGIIEEDFQRAELEVVPAFKSCDIGFDRSMIGSYGQDDRVCAYTSLEAIIQSNTSNKTKLCILVDKEEIGSTGSTGMESTFLENTIAELCNLTVENYSDITLRRALSNSKFLSSDVTAAVDPTYEDVNEKLNSSFLGKGVAVMKYTGSRGKALASDANAEFMGEITNLLNKDNVIWQSGELGKVDLGGGGTVAMFVAKYGMEVVDIGPPILSMHSPLEIASKIDIYMSYKAYMSFYNAE